MEGLLGVEGEIPEMTVWKFLETCVDRTKQLLSSSSLVVSLLCRGLHSKRAERIKT